MSFTQVELQKGQFIKSYIAIENIRNISYWYCCCQIYSGCPTIDKFLKSDRRYSCYCQLVDHYTFDLLHKVKRDISLRKSLYNEILADVEVLKVYKNVNHFASNFDVFDAICFIERLIEERRSDFRDFLF